MPPKSPPPLSALSAQAFPRVPAEIAKNREGERRELGSVLCWKRKEHERNGAVGSESRQKEDMQDEARCERERKKEGPRVQTLGKAVGRGDRNAGRGGGAGRREAERQRRERGENQSDAEHSVLKNERTRGGTRAQRGNGGCACACESESTRQL